MGTNGLFKTYFREGYSESRGGVDLYRYSSFQRELRDEKPIPAGQPIGANVIY